MSTDPTDDDRDRAAILARRQRFIALALSSLATACTSSEPVPSRARPQACLKYSLEPRRKDEPEVPDPGTVGTVPKPADEGTPLPCLSLPADAVDVPPVDDGKAVPAPCLSMTPPKAGTRKVEKRPKARPTPCLEIVMPDEGE